MINIASAAENAVGRTTAGDLRGGGAESEEYDAGEGELDRDDYN